MKRIRLPRLRRRGGTMPAYKPDPDTVVARLSIGAVGCQRCGQTMPHPTGQPDPDSIAWLQKHHCEPEET